LEETALKIAGIVCEYNPMHNGHVFQIEKTRLAGATHIVCAMSGNFVQRGEPAFVDKWTRAEIAVNCGADLVVDIPTPWSCDSAENFAFGAVSMLASLGIDILSFGCENADSKLLEICADAVSDKETGLLLKDLLEQGKSYPSALHEAVMKRFGEETASVISSPNSTLAIEYIRALRKLSYTAKIFAVERKNTPHDEMRSSGVFASSLALREMNDFSKAQPYMPQYSYEKIFQAVKNGFTAVDSDVWERAILSSIRQMSAEEIEQLLGIKSGIARRLADARLSACSYDDLLGQAKTKCITMARLKRSVIRLFLKIPYDISFKQPPYIKVLAANEKGFEILKNACGPIPYVIRHSDIMKLGSYAKEVYDIQCRSTDLYMLMQKKARACSFEQTSPVISVKNL